jgi:hypothetical protein
MPVSMGEVGLVEPSVREGFGAVVEVEELGLCSERAVGGGAGGAVGYEAAAEGLLDELADKYGVASDGIGAGRTPDENSHSTSELTPMPHPTSC